MYRSYLNKNLLRGIVVTFCGLVLILSFQNFQITDLRNAPNKGSSNSVPSFKSKIPKNSTRGNKILVKPKAGIPNAAFDRIHKSKGCSVDKKYPRLGNIQVINLPPGKNEAEALLEYKNDPSVEYAEPDYIMSATATIPIIPNDMGLGSPLWGLDNNGTVLASIPDADIDAPEAWSIRTDASSIIVGVIDTGIDYTHPDLIGNMWINPGEIPGNGIDDDHNGYIDDVYGINAIAGAANPGNPMDDFTPIFHGTHVAGTIGATGNNGLGVVGVAWKVKLMALKFLGATGTGANSDAIKCLDYAISKGVKILNASWGGSGFSQALMDAIYRAQLAGIIFVGAAGNDALDSDLVPHYPSSYKLPNVVAVAASTPADTLASFSTYGANSVHLAAPGTDIYSTMAGNQYQLLSGTSMATPHVSGALALIMAQFPGETIDQYVQRLLSATDPVLSLAGKTITGGRLNLYNALAGIQRTITVPPIVIDPPVFSFIFSPASKVFVNQSVTIAGSFGGLSTSKVIDFGDGSTPLSLGTTTSVNHVYTKPGIYTVSITATGPGGVKTETKSLSVLNTYDVSLSAFQWVDTTGMTDAVIPTDSSSAPIALPFLFPLLDQQFSSLIIKEEGTLVLGNSPNLSTLFVLPSFNWRQEATSKIRYGATSDGGFVVSYENVLGGESVLAFTYFASFQVLIYPSGLIKMQYKDFGPENPKNLTSPGLFSKFDFGLGKSVGFNQQMVVGEYISVPYTIMTPVTELVSLSNGSTLRFVPTGLVLAPDVPTLLTSQLISFTQLKLNWVANSKDETGFIIERSVNGAAFAAIGQTAAGIVTYTDNTVTSGQSYSYRVRAFNSAGSSPFSSPLVVKIATPLATPTGLISTGVSSTQINLSWVDVAIDETGYKVYRSTDNVTFTLLATLAAGSTSYSSTALTADKTYYYRVAASNATAQGAFATVSNVTLAAPTTLAAKALSVSTIHLTWLDKSTLEGEFQIEWGTSPTSFPNIVKVGPNLTAWDHTLLAANSKIYYRIKARKALPESNSNYSAVANAVTPAK